MGSLVPSKKTKNRCNNNQETVHFVTGLAGKSNLASTEVMYGTLSTQIRDGSYPLHMAVQAGAPLNVVERILREGSDLALQQNKRGETVLHVALSASTQNEHVIDLLLNDRNIGLAASGVKDKRNGNLPIHIAAMTGCSVEAAKELIEFHPKSIHEMNKQSKTPLDLALEYSNCSEDVARLFEIIDHSESSLQPNN